MLNTSTQVRRKICEPECRDDSRLSGPDTLKLPSPPEEEELETDTVGLSSGTNSLKHLVKEFKDLYEQRLRCVELDTTINGGERLQKKVNFLLSYVKDLEDQNQVLIQTVEDLREEADHEISEVGLELRTSNGIEEVSEVDRRTMRLDELVGSTAHIPTSYCSFVQITSELEDLEIQLQAKNKTISDLRRELDDDFQQKQKVLGSSKRLEHLQSELSCLQRIHKDNVKEIAEKDIRNTKLRATVELLQQEGSHTHAQLCKLSEELKRKEEEWRQMGDVQRLGYEKELQKAEERRRQEEEEWRRAIEEERKANAKAVEEQAEEAAVLNAQMKEREEHVRNLDQDVVGLRATQDSLKRTLAMKEKHTKQLVRENTELKDRLASLQSGLQTRERTLRDISETLDQTKTSLQTERQHKQQIQEQLHHAKTEMERLQQELTNVHHTTEKKIHKKEIKTSALVEELAERKRQHSECQKELLQREKALQKLCEEKDELRAKTDDRGRECVHLKQTQERLEADLALSHEKLHTLHLEVRSRDQLILQLRAEMKSAEQKHQKTQEQVATLEAEVRHLKHEARGHQQEACKLSRKVRDIECLKDRTEKDQQQLCDQLCTSQQQVQAFEEKLKKQEVEMELLHRQLKGAEEERKDASLQRETVAIFKQKYTAAIEKVHRVQGRVELLEEELRYSQQQVKDSQLVTHSVKDELREMVQRYHEKVSQWENSQEALDQLTDELQATQNLLRESRQEVHHLKGMMGSVQERVDTLEQQKIVLDCDLRLYQKSHSHPDEEYLSLLKDRQQLQQRCAEQVERHAECEKAILQMKSELQRQIQEKMALKKSLLASNHTHKSSCTQLEQEVIRLKKEVADNQKVHAALLQESEEELKEARREAARRSRERGEFEALQEELRKEKEETRRAIREKRGLSGHVRQLSQEVEELRSRHQVTVEELAARAEEARRMEGCLTEGKLAEEKIRSMAARLESEVTELRRNLQHAVDQKLQAEREKQDAQEQVETLHSELEGMRSDNKNLRHESQLVMTNVNRWITEQKASNKSLTAQMKAQNKVLLIITEEKEHLQEANDTLNAEVKRLKEVANEKERDMERFKAQIRDQGILQDEIILEKQGCVARNLCKINDMQTRLRSNLEAIGMLNQQLNALSKENKCLRRQLEEERSMRRQLDKHRSSIHLPLSLSARPPPPSTSLPSSHRHPPSPSSDAATGDVQTHSGPERPGESRALGGAYRKETGWLSGRCSVWENKRGPDQMKPPEDFDLS
ncbi:trichohyalin-like [Xyrichtys novacula]|uniref:Trichohyalin-like n=1 Tax=Xyrichtys novacula TaxID=13765 RepID=A0AAV1H8N9_XYRNO|nr:trichohyalin-like [Xyrichtys novacula]